MRPLSIIERRPRPNARLLVALALALLTVALACPIAASAGDNRYESIEAAIEAGVLDPAVIGKPGKDGRLEGFVIFPDDAAERRGFADEKKDLFNRLEQGLEPLYDYDPMPLVLARFADPSAVLAALNEPLVTGIGANRENVPLLAESLPLVRQPQAQVQGHTGAGTTIAVIDGGIDYTNGAFGTCGQPGDPGCKVAASIGFAPDDCPAEEGPTPQQIDDDDGGCWQPGDEGDPDPHGTNVAAIASGVAPDARVIALDVLSGGSASDSTVFKAIRWVVMHAPQYKIRSLNLSLGAANTFFTASCSNANPYLTLFGQARARGVLPVVSSGNRAFGGGTYRDGISWPACTPNAVSVGAVYDANLGPQAWGTCTDPTTTADQLVCFSQSGSLLSMLAPGSSIDAGGFAMSGTSQAAPHVAGAAAVLAGAAPGAPPHDIEQALEVGPPIFDPRNGLPKARLDLEVSLSFFRCDGAAVTIHGTNFGETIVGTPGPDVIAALGGDDAIIALGADDRVCAGAGNDIVDGGDGSDRLLGEAGDDSLKDGDPSCAGGFCVFPYLWSDVLVGGNGVDKADYSSRAVPLALSLDGAANDGESGEGDRIASDIEGAAGGSSDDTLVGDGLSNILRGGAGTDNLDGRAGADVLNCGPDMDWFAPDAQDQSVVDCENPWRRLPFGN